MTPKTKIYLAAAAAVVLLFLVSSIITRIEISRMEKQVGAAKEKALAAAKAAEASEIRAAEYKEKIASLESSLAGIRLIATKQNEELEKITADTSNARDRLRDARSVRTISATAAELCEKLSEIGHGCD